MKGIIIGSRALKYHFPDYKKQPNDYDILCENEEITSTYYYENIIKKITPKFEFHEIPPLWNIVDKSERYISPEYLLTLKASHIFWDIKWEKHMFDIQFILKKGYKINKELFYRLYNFWNEYHSKNNRCDLKMTKEDFFNNQLNKYDHDYLHTLINPNPIYKKILKNNEEVDVSEEKFNNLSYENKLELVREEIYVMAYERLNNEDYRKAYSRLLKKFIISYCPTWEALFIIKNFINLHKPIINYKQKLDYELSRNSIKA